MHVWVGGWVGAGAGAGMFEYMMFAGVQCTDTRYVLALNTLTSGSLARIGDMLCQHGLFVQQ